MKFLLNEKEFNEIEKAELVELYKELYDRYFCQHAELKTTDKELHTVRAALASSEEDLQKVRTKLKAVKAELFTAKADRHQLVKATLTATDTTLSSMPDTSVNTKSTIVFNNINANQHKVAGKVMSETQLKTILSFMAERDYGFSTTELIGKSTLWANALINKMIKTKAEHPKRIKPYNPDELYDRFIRKYPEWYKEVSAK